MPDIKTEYLRIRFVPDPESDTEDSRVFVMRSVGGLQEEMGRVEQNEYSDDYDFFSFDRIILGSRELRDIADFLDQLNKEKP